MDAVGECMIPQWRHVSFRVRFGLRLVPWSSNLVTVVNDVQI